jgi:hypothetical protein
MISENGQTAIRRIPPRQKYVKIGLNEYVFVVQADIAIAWIKDEDVPAILSLRESCNCGNASKKHVFFLADEVHLRRWTNRGGR